MPMVFRRFWCCVMAMVWLSAPSLAVEANSDRLQLMDVFELEWASDPQISPNGERIVYVRNFFDVMKDRQRSNLWVINADGTNHRPLTTGTANDSSPRWSPDGKRLLYVSALDGGAQIWCRWMDDGHTAKLTRLPKGPGNMQWSPDGQQIAFSMFVDGKRKPLVQLPTKPKGADWADAPKEIDDVSYRFDGKGYLTRGFTHLFVVPADGGTARQITEGDFNHGGSFSWTPDSKNLVFSANRNKDWQYQPRESELYEIAIATGELTKLTDRVGPDSSPVVSPDGKTIAYLGLDDEKQGYQVTHLYLLDRPTKKSVMLAAKLDRDISELQWVKEKDNSLSLYFQYDDEGDTKLGLLTDVQNRSGKLVKTPVDDIGGTTLGRPYGSGSYSVANNGRVAYTKNSPLHPADVAVWNGKKSAIKQLTHLNDDLLKHKKLGQVEEFWVASKKDGRKIQCWLVKPPDFDAKKKYPMILEIHGGPFANYGPRFAAEMQLYAAAGYLVLYCNPRGSTSYGEEFGNLIHHAYPGDDYDDLMSAVNAVCKRQYVDAKKLYVTGGSGGGVLSAWIVGKTDRFRAAVVVKPVINWFSFVLTADAYPFFTQYWFPGMPWDNLVHYMKRSPLSLVGNVKTPTMLITGEQDFRTPMSETEQYYQALKLRKVDTMLVRIPGASHNIAGRPSQMIAKVAYVLAWFRKYE